MSGAIINDYSQTDSDILAVQLTLDATRVGFHQVSLTNYDSTSESQIAAGSIIEVGGALYKFTANETITGSPSDGTVYIMIVPATTTCTAQYTNTAPTWSDSKQGFYGTGGSANYRYLEYKITKTASVWDNKRKFDIFPADVKLIQYDGTPTAGFRIDETPVYITTVTVTLSSSTTGSTSHGITNAKTNSRVLLATPLFVSGGVYDSLSYAYSSPNIGPSLYWDDTTVTIQREATVSATYRVTFLYK